MYTHPVQDLEQWRIVRAGGGRWKGRFLDQVLFQSPRTDNTLSILEKDLTPEAVRAIIAQSDAKFNRRSCA